MTAKETKTKEEKNKREIVIPGEIIASGDFLPGDWTLKQGDDIISARLGIVEKSGKLAKVIPLSGVYVPRRGNVVIGRIEDLTMRGWITDILAPYSAFLLLKECPVYVNESEMAEVYGINDLVVAKIVKVGRASIDLTTRGRGLGKISMGMIIKVNPHRVPRVIGKEGSMIKQIKIISGCEITVGQNGLIWIKGNNFEDEIFAKKAIEFVVDNTLSLGLTERVEEWLKKNRKQTKEMKEKLEKIELKEDSKVESEEDTAENKNIGVED